MLFSIPLIFLCSVGRGGFRSKLDLSRSLNFSRLLNLSRPLNFSRQEILNSSAFFLIPLIFLCSVGRSGFRSKLDLSSPLNFSRLLNLNRLLNFSRRETPNSSALFHSPDLSLVGWSGWI